MSANQYIIKRLIAIGRFICSRYTTQPALIKCASDGAIYAVNEAARIACEAGVAQGIETHEGVDIVQIPHEYAQALKNSITARYGSAKTINL